MGILEEAKRHFDVSHYIKTLAAKNRLAIAEQFYGCTCTGPESLEGIVQTLTRQRAFVCVDDTSPGTLVQRSGGWLMQRHATVWLVKRYPLDDESERSKAMDVCRQLMRQFCSRLIADEDVLQHAFIYLDAKRITTLDLGAHFIPAATGVSFMFAWEEPTDLQYHVEEWTS